MAGLTLENISGYFIEYVRWLFFCYILRYCSSMKTWIITITFQYKFNYFVYST